MRLIRNSSCAAIACLALAACVSSTPAPTPAPAPAPRPAPAPPAPRPVPTSSHWMDAPLTPGDWSYREGLASFGEWGAVPRLTLRCDGRGSVAVSYLGSASQPAAMTIHAETMARAISQVVLTATDTPGTVLVTGSVPARDPLLDAMAFSKGRFAVEVSGAPTLYVPAYPEVTRVIEDCR